MVAAISRDGFLTDGDDPQPEHWTSDEDRQQLQKLLRSHSLHIMGGTTYEIHHPGPVEGATKVILTRTPEAETEQPGKLLFRSATPQELVEEFSADYDKCLLLGGSSIYRQFLEAELVDEIYLTVEPVTHGSGVALLGDDEQLEDVVSVEPTVTRLNDGGTELHHYQLQRTIN